MTKADEETERQELEEQLQAATELVQETVGRMLQDSEIDPHIVLLALARVAGEFTAATALSEDEQVEETLSHVIEIVQEVARGSYDAIQIMMMPVAGNA
jgi:hypothetical protein